MDLRDVTIHVMNLTALDLNLLLVLEAVLQEGNVTRAAARLGRSQPAISNALARLRSLLDDPIVIRTARGLQPTARATALGEAIRPALDEIRQALGGPGAFNPAAARGTVRIAANDYLQSFLLPAVAARVIAATAHVKLVVRPLRSLRPRAELERGEFDLAIDWFPHAPPPAADVFGTALFVDYHAAIVRDDHPQVRHRLALRTFTALRHVFVSLYDDPPAHGIVDAALFRFGLRRDVAVTVPHMLAAVATVAQSDLVATVPVRVARAAARALPIRAFSAPVELPDSTLRLLWHARVDQDPTNRWVRQQIVEAAAAMSDKKRVRPGRRLPAS
jgi:DNA-binding transcriptional LysR family regulator